MHRRVERLTAAVLVGIMAVSLTACGSMAGEKGMIDETAISRSADDLVEGIFIDDEKVALAGSASASSAVISVAQSVFDMVNRQRVNAGLSALEWSDELAVAALVRASELPVSFSHTRPDGSQWLTVNSDIMFGENLARYYYNADDVVAAWTESPSHYENLMDPKFMTTGIAVYEAPDGKWYWAQEFGY